MLVDLDEGYYLTSGQFVFDGKLPYRDFFFTQTPLSPYIFGLWLKLVGTGWYQARLLGALCTTAIGWLLFREAYRATGKLPVAWWVAVMYGGSSLIHEWFVLAKTYGISILMVLVVYLLIEREWRAGTPSSVRLFGAGLVAGLTIDLRLMFLAPVAALTLLVLPRRWAVFLGGVIAALGFCLPFYLAAPQAFVFDNWGYHHIRSSAGLIGGFSQKLEVLEKLVGLSPPFFGQSLQNLIFSALLLWALVERKMAWRPLLVAVSLAAVSILPTPTFLQYFCVCLPFLLLALLPWINQRVQEKTGKMVLVGSTVLTLLALPLALAPSYGALSTLWPKANGYYRRQITAHRRLIKTIQDNSAPDDLILVSCPGYAFATGRRMVPMTENNFPHSNNIFPRLSEADCNKYRFLTNEQTEAVIRNRTAKMVVLGEGVFDKATYLHRHQILKESGYKLLWTEDALTPYVRVDK